MRYFMSGLGPPVQFTIVNLYQDFAEHRELVRCVEVKTYRVF